jgi:hypothetical protein
MKQGEHLFLGCVNCIQHCSVVDWYTGWHNSTATVWACLCKSKKKESEVVLVHTMKAYRGCRGIGPLILNLSSRYMWVVSSVPWLLYPWVKQPCDRLDTRLGWPQSWCEHIGGEKTFLFLPVIEPQTAQPIARWLYQLYFVMLDVLTVPCLYIYVLMLFVAKNPKHYQTNTSVRAGILSNKINCMYLLWHLPQYREVYIIYLLKYLITFHKIFQNFITIYTVLRLC